MTRSSLLWCLTLAAWLPACHRDHGGSGSSASAAPSSQGPTAGTTSTECLTQFDFLVPFQKYGDSDLIRSIVVDGDQVVFRNMTDVFRVPLAGGTPTIVSKAPALTLDGKTTVWVAGDRLVSQSPHEPIFMASPKAGGAWTTIIDLSHEKLGGGRSTTNRILHDIGKGSSSATAGSAIFDGTSFYWTEHRAAARGSVPSSSIRTVALSGGDGRTLYEAPGEFGSLAKAGDHLVFMHLDPPPPDPEADKHGAAKKGGFHIAPKGPSALWSIPIAGGKAERLIRIANMFGNEVMLTDGPTVYVTGYEDEDISKPGIFRIAATGGSGAEQLEAHAMQGAGFLYGDRVVLVGSGLLGKPAPGTVPQSAKIVLTGARKGGKLERTACIVGNYTTHAYAVAGKTLLISIFRSDDRLAGIIRISLP